MFGIFEPPAASAGSPLTDAGHFLRYEQVTRPVAEQHFSNGFLGGGGRLPQDWRQLAKLLDLAALRESLTHADLPEEIRAELVELVSATVENRDPQLI